MRAFIALLALPLLFAQESKYETKLGTETIEGLGGVIYRHGDGRADRAGGTRLLGGLNRWVSLYGEFGYTRVLSEEFHADPLKGFCAASGRTVCLKEEYRGSLMDFGGGGMLHLSGARIQPYLLAGVGSSRISGKVAIGALKATDSNYHLSSTVGGGIRIFATRHIGFSAEVKSSTIRDAKKYERYALGAFYQGRAGRF